MKNHHEKPAAPILTQFLIFSAILLVSYLISLGMSVILPQFPVPTPLIGLILLFLCLTSGLVRLEQVEKLSQNLLGMIGLLFVPSGISLANSLHLFREEGIKIIVVVILATIILLLSVAYTSKIISKIADKFSAKRTKIVRGAYND
ncbi:CidA/LrgA family protein [Leuconostoc lactis]|uniref:CidA/LrgA family protein n=1 Tax=Leuconostoc lactis TaxID=1246 RepID=UPI00241DDD89|nr:CidA/LrgA family protein [Leuconostoc lactis]